jgi:hypothetical protein
MTTTAINVTYFDVFSNAFSPLPPSQIFCRKNCTGIATRATNARPCDFEWIVLFEIWLDTSDIRKICAAHDTLSAFQMSICCARLFHIRDTERLTSPSDSWDRVTVSYAISSRWSYSLKIRIDHTFSQRHVPVGHGWTGHVGVKTFYRIPRRCTRIGPHTAIFCGTTTRQHFEIVDHTKDTCDCEQLWLTCQFCSSF